MNIQETLKLIDKSIAESLSIRGFEAVYSDEQKKGELPINEDDGKFYVDYASERGNIRILYSDEKLCFQIGNGEGDDMTFKSVSASLFDENADEKDVKYIANEFNDCIESRFKLKDDSKPVKHVLTIRPITK